MRFLPVLARASREPLAHFVALGAAIFAIHAAFAAPPRDARVVVSADFVEGLRREHAARLGRSPTPDEERALVDQFVDEEVLYREAVAMGLDRGDPIIRRRLAQKMTFLAEDEAAREPSDEELRDYLAAHADRYREAQRVSFRHVFMSRDRRGEAAAEDARRAIGELSRGAISAEGAGDPFLQGSEIKRRTQVEIESMFGAGFAAKVIDAEPGAWLGPLSSSYGEHAILVLERADGAAPDLASVRARVRSDLLTERRAAASREMRARLRRRYAIEIEAPKAAVAGGR